jgi:hypothetical protein
MIDVTEILSSLERGDLKAADQSPPLVHEELRRLAARKLANESPGQTLQATALVYERIPLDPASNASAAQS